MLDEVEAGYRLEIPKVCRHVFEVKLICLTNTIVQKSLLTVKQLVFNNGKSVLKVLKGNP